MLHSVLIHLRLIGQHVLGSGGLEQRLLRIVRKVCASLFLDLGNRLCRRQVCVLGVHAIGKQIAIIRICQDSLCFSDELNVRSFGGSVIHFILDLDHRDASSDLSFSKVLNVLADNVLHRLDAGRGVLIHLADSQLLGRNRLNWYLCHIIYPMPSVLRTCP